MNNPACAARPCVLVTRPRDTADRWLLPLREQGLLAAALPLLAIAPPEGADALACAQAELAGKAAAVPAACPGSSGSGSHPQALPTPPLPTLVMFVSPTAVQRFWSAALDWPAGVLAGATGPGTVAALREAGVPQASILSPPEAGGRFDSEALWAVLAPMRDWQGCPVWIVRGQDGRDWLSRELAAAGARVRMVTAYARRPPAWSPGERAVLECALADPAGHCWLLSSSEAVGHLPTAAPGVDWSAHSAVATHARIGDAARRIGFGMVQVLPPQPEAIAKALLGEHRFAANASALPAGAPADGPGHPSIQSGRS